MVSVIIPSFNRAHIISETLDSVLKQTYQNWECIVVDDGSTDETLEIVNQYANSDARFFFFKRTADKSKGPSSCRNIGIEKAQGDFIVFLDSDDLLAPNCFENRINFFSENKEADFLVFNMEVFEKTPIIETVRAKKIEKSEAFFSFLQLKTVWHVTSPIYKAEFLKNKIFFNEKLMVYEDLEFAVKAIFYSKTIFFFDQTDCYYRNDIHYFQKHEDVSFVNKIIKSFVNYVYEIDRFIQQNNINKKETEKIKYSVSLAYKKNYKRFIIPYSPLFFQDNKILFKFLNKNGYFRKQNKWVFLFSNFMAYNFYKIKGFGLFRFIDFLLK